MKKTLITLLLTTATLGVRAQVKTMAEVFRAMPDSVFPTLSTTNRLDLIDFMEAGMKSEVTNLLEGTTTLTALTSDSLSLQMSGSLRVDMKLLPAAEPSDSITQTIRVARTYIIKENQSERVVDTYTSDWHLLSSQVEHDSLLKCYDEVFSKP